MKIHRHWLAGLFCLLVATSARACIGSCNILLGIFFVFLTTSSYADSPEELLHRYREGNKSAIAELISRAEKNEIKAQVYLGNAYHMENNYVDAVNWYTKAAESGDAAAQVNLGLLYRDGKGVTQDYGRAFLWYSKAATQDLPNAQYALGDMFWTGKGIAKNHGEAADWYRKAADNGHAGAQANLGYLYLEGDGVKKDYQEAAKWFRKAAEQGDMKSQEMLGSQYREGTGVPKDYQEALKWYQKAAEQGHVRAMGWSGLIYQIGGFGVSQDYSKAKTWFEKAANKEDSAAMNALGSFNEKGLGTERNIPEALKWYRKAAEKNNQGAKENLARLESQIQSYRTAFNNARSASEIEKFISTYERNDFENLVPQARTKLAESWKPANEPLLRASQADTRSGDDGYMTSVVFSGDGKILASGGHDRIARLATLTGGGTTEHIAFLPGTAILGVVGTNSIRIWDVGTKKDIRVLNTPNAESGGQGHLQIAFSPDGKILASSEGKVIKLWDIPNGNTRTLYGHKHVKPSFAFSPDGRILATGGEYGDDYANIRLWEVTTGRQIRLLTGQKSDHVRRIVFSPDGKILASASVYSIRLWDVATGNEIRKLDGSGIPIAFSPNGRILAFTKSKTIKLWDIDSGNEIFTLGGHTGYVTDVAISPDGKTLISSGGRDDGTIRFWDVGTGREIYSLDARLGGSRNEPIEVQNIVLSQSGQLLAALYDYGYYSIFAGSNGPKGNDIVLYDFGFIKDCTVAYQHATKVNTNQAYDLFLKHYSDCKFAGEAKRTLCDLNFIEAKKVSSIAAYDRYLKEFGHCSQASDAKSLSFELTMKSYRTAKALYDFGRKQENGGDKSQATKVYELVKSRHPNDTYAEMAQNRLDIMEAQRGAASANNSRAENDRQMRKWQWTTKFKTGPSSPDSDGIRQLTTDIACGDGQGTYVTHHYGGRYNYSQYFASGKNGIKHFDSMDEAARYACTD